MSIKLRLARLGAKKKPFYRIVVADSFAPRDGRFIDIVGTYNPFSKEKETKVILNYNKINKWLTNGAKPTHRVAHFLNNDKNIKYKISKMFFLNKKNK